MGRYFGTDGFRGEAGTVLTATHAYQIGRFLGYLAVHPDEETTVSHPRILIGKDARRSGYMYEDALGAGLLESGADVYVMHVTTTPSVAYITRVEDFAFGIMVSASHNPFTDNGIKILNSDGEKLDEDTIDLIEDYIDGTPAELPVATAGDIGRKLNYEEAQERYAGYLISAATRSFSGMKVGLDCANGSSYALAEKVFSALGAETHVINNHPDGLNINVDCGSTHIEGLQRFVKEQGLDIGFAFDGDADRCLAVDENGELVNGDQIMYLTALHLKELGQLTTNTVVTTIMSNFGLYKALDAVGIAYEKTAVGDKYVWENMRENGHVVGGEQSGHVIYSSHARTGDGILTAIMVMECVLASGKKLSELAAPCKMYPQVLKNVHVDSKEGTLEDSVIMAAIEEASLELGDTGRVLVRKSGTEPVIRVMAEAEDEATCEKHVDAIIEAMRATGHLTD